MEVKAEVQLGWNLGGMWGYSGKPSWKCRLKPDTKALLECSVDRFIGLAPRMHTLFDADGTVVNKTKSVSLWVSSSSREKKTKTGSIKPR